MNLFKDKIDDSLTTFVNMFSSKKYGYVSEDDLWNKGFKCNSIVYSVVSQISSKTASLPVVLMNGEDVVSSGNDIYELYYNEWNSEYGHEEGIRLTSTNLSVFGIAYIQKKRSGLMVDELHVLPNQLVTPQQNIRSFYDSPEYYDFYDGVNKARIPASDMIVIRLPFDLKNKQQNYSQGLSPLQPAWDTVLASNNRSEAEKSTFKNRGASGFISPKAGKEYGGKWSDTVYQYIRGRLKELIGGAGRANELVPVQQPMEFTQVGMSSSDMKLLESELPHVRRIAGVYEYPSQLVGDWQSSQYANYKEATKNAYVSAVLPRWDLIDNALQKGLFEEINGLTGSSYYLKVDKTRITVLNKTWEDNLNALPNDLQSKIVESLSTEDIERIKTNIGIKFENNEQ